MSKCLIRGCPLVERFGARAVMDKAQGYDIDVYSHATSVGELVEIADGELVGC